MTGSIWKEGEGADPASDPKSRSTPDTSLWRENEGHDVQVGSTESLGLWDQKDALPSPPSLAPRISKPPRTSVAKRTLRLIGKLALPLLLSAFVGDAIYSGFQIRRALTAVQADLDSVSQLVESGRFDEALAAARGAERSSEAALDFVAHPSIRILDLLPIDDVEAVEALTEASGRAAQGAQVLFPHVEPDGLLGGGPEALYSEGEVQIDKLEGLAPVLEDSLEHLRAAKTAMEPEFSPIFDEIDRALVLARSRVDDAEHSLETSAALVDVLPPLLGDGESRRYLLAFQALGEARATGGLVGFYGELIFDEGKVELTSIAPIRKLAVTTDPPVVAPAWFERNYGPQQALRQVQQANVSPNFPTVAEVLLRMYSRTTGDELDGVVAMDPVAMSHLMRGMDPIETSSLGPVTADNVVDVVLRDSYLELDGRTQNAFLTELITEFWKRLRSGDVDPAGLMTGLGETASTSHLKMYSRAPEEQEALADLDVHGGIPEDHPVQMVFHNNYGPNKVDYFLDRHIDTRIELDRTGSMNVRVTIRLENEAPPGPPSNLLGFKEEGTEPGFNTMVLNLLLPRGASVGDFKVDGESTVPFTYSDDQNPVVGGLIEIPPGESATVQLAYRAPGVIDPDGRLIWSQIGQTTAHPDTYSLQIRAPYGLRFSDVSAARLEDPYISNGRLQGQRRFELQLVPSG